MTWFTALLIGVIATLALIGLVSKTMTPPHQPKGFIAVALLAMLYLLGLLKLLRN